MDNPFSYNSGWRDHNPNLRKKRSGNFFSKRVTLLCLCLCLFVAAYLLFFPIPWYESESGRNGDASSLKKQNYHPTANY